jgi:peptide/nickel transport system substrate-binding protein
MNTLIQENPYDAAAPLIPDLAQGWTVDEDNQGITFSFQDDINWHNGEAFVCEDARFTLEVMLEPAETSQVTHSYMRGYLSHVDPASITCEDDQTLSMRFKAPNPTPLLALSNRRARIFNKAWFEAGGEDVMFQDSSVGTGAYIWEEGQKVGFDTQHFSKNPDYFYGDGSLPYTDRLTITGILDESAQQAAMLAHQGDWHWVRNWGQYSSYVNHDQIQTVIRATRGHLELWLNSRNAPFDNIRVRQAIFMGIDRAAGIKVMQDGHGSAGFMFAPGSAWELDDATGCAIASWCPADTQDAQDARRAEAKAILDEEGFDYDKTYLFTVESDAQVVGRATFVQEQLRLMGIKTDFDLLETIALRAQEQNGTWGDIMPSNATMAADDPSAGLGGYHRCSSSSNMTHYPDQPCDEKLEALFEQIDGTTDFADRKKLSDEAQVYIMQQYWKMPVYWEQEAVAFWPEVGGYAHFPAPFGSFVKYQHLWINESKRDDKGYKGQMHGLPGGI